VLKADFWIHSVVEGGLIHGHEAKYLYADPPLTPDHHMRRKAFRTGLEWLAAHFGYDRAERRGSSPAPPIANGNGVDQPRRRTRGLPVMFNPATDDRPEAAEVTAAVIRLRGRANPP
jgi:hypothetical protein